MKPQNFMRFFSSILFMAILVLLNSSTVKAGKFADAYGKGIGTTTNASVHDLTMCAGEVFEFIDYEKSDYSSYGAITSTNESRVSGTYLGKVTITKNGSTWYGYRIRLIAGEAHTGIAGDTDTTITAKTDGFRVTVVSDHDYQKTLVVGVPTDTELGQKIDICDICGHKRSEAISSVPMGSTEITCTDYSICASTSETKASNFTLDSSEETAPSLTIISSDPSILTTRVTSPGKITGILGYTHKYDLYITPSQVGVSYLTVFDPDDNVLANIKVNVSNHIWQDNGCDAATCNATGTRYYRCSCGAQNSEPIAIDPDAHNWNDGVETTPASCKATGIKTYTCTLCTTTKQESIDKLTYHTNVSMVESIQGTCISAGVYNATCTVCGSTWNEPSSINPSVHKNTVMKNMKDATPTEKGYTGDLYCNDCHKVVMSGTEVDYTPKPDSSGEQDKKPSSNPDEKVNDGDSDNKDKVNDGDSDNKDKVLDENDSNEDNNIDDADDSSNEGEDEEDEIETILVEKIKISASSTKIAAGKKVTLSAAVIPNAASNTGITWKSSNTKYAVVSAKGIVTTKKAGAGKKVVITAAANDESGVKAQISISILKDSVKSVKVTAPAKTLKAGKTMKLKAAVGVTGKKANKTLAWKSSNTQYATVDKNGKVKALNKGKGKNVTITATATDGSGKKGSIKLRIK